MPIITPALNIYGRLCYQKGNYALALDSWRQAEATYRQIGDLPGATSSQLNQVQALQALGLYSQAKAKISAIEQIIPQLPPLLQLRGWRSLGETLQATGNLQTSQFALFYYCHPLAVPASIPSGRSHNRLPRGRVHLPTSQPTASRFRDRHESPTQPPLSRNRPPARNSSSRSQISRRHPVPFLCPGQPRWIVRISSQEIQPASVSTASPSVN